MTTLELRSKLHKAVETMPEEKLPDLLHFLQTLNQLPSEEEINRFIDKVFREDHELLKLLAD